MFSFIVGQLLASCRKSRSEILERVELDPTCSPQDTALGGVGGVPHPVDIGLWAYSNPESRL